MQQAETKGSPRRRSRAKRIETFRPFQLQRWQNDVSSIITTVRRVVNALGAIEDRHPEWHSPLAVAQVLLCRLEDVRAEVGQRSINAALALESGHVERVRLELGAITQLVRAAGLGGQPELHGVSISRDRLHHRIDTSIP